MDHRNEIFHDKVDNLQSAEERESSKESHGAANDSKLVGKGDTHVLDDLVVGGRVKVDLDDSERMVRLGCDFELVSVMAIKSNYKTSYLRSFV